LMSCGLRSLPVYGTANQTNMVSSRLIAGKHQVWHKNKTEAVWPVNIIESTQQELHRHEIQRQENAQLSVWLLQ
jgi:hypothetical protein